MDFGHCSYLEAKKIRLHGLAQSSLLTFYLSSVLVHCLKTDKVKWCLLFLIGSFAPLWSLKELTLLPVLSKILSTYLVVFHQAVLEMSHGVQIWLKT